MPPLFLYGTLLDPGVLRRQSCDPRLLGTARPGMLGDHARVPFRGTPYPTLVRSAGRWVEGLLVFPGPSAMRALRRYEGPCYRMLPVRVWTGRGQVRARAFAVPRWMAAAGAAWFPAPPSRRAGGVRP